ncbi:MAG TPA: phosphoglycerate mutase family protein [Nitrososphaeraceae archaeon]|nr:phosphoglycerate mutase family protein [Nitrososphaeraceae archaeon]
MDLYLIRHGQSGLGQTLDRTSGSDRVNKKTLTAAGIAQIERTGKALKTLNIVPDAIVTSPLSHSQKSAEIVGSILFGDKRNTDGKPKKRKLKNIQVWNDLAPEGDKAIVYKNLAKFEYDSKILIIGHEPFLTKMAAEIVSSSSSSPDTHKRLRGSISGSNSNLRYSIGNYRSVVLKRSGLVRISITSMNPKLKGELRWLLTPMLLKAISRAKKETKNENKNKEYPPIASSFGFAITKNKSTVMPIHH